MDQSAPLFSLIVPTYNESENLPVLVEALTKVLKSTSHEILIVDDDSPDRTWAVGEELAKRFPSVRVVRRQSNRGLSPAVVEGLKKSRGQILGVMDADLSHDETLLPRLIEEIQLGADVAVGSRRVPGGGADKWPWYRRLFSSAATLFARKCLGLNLNDPMSGYFVLKRSVFDYSVGRLQPTGYKILLEIMGHARVNKVVELPYVFKDRRQGYSKLSGPVVLQFFIQVGRLFAKRLNRLTVDEKRSSQPKTKNLTKIQWAAILIATLIGALVRLNLARHPIGGVEIERLQATLSGQFAWDPFRPPMLYFLMYLWSPVAVTPFLWRLPIVCFSLAAVPAIYFFTKTLTKDRDTAFWAAFFTALSAFQIEFAHWLNDYPILGLLFLANAYCFWKYFEEHKGRFYLAGFLITHIISLQTHYMALDVLIFQGLYLLWRQGWRGVWPFVRFSLIVLLFAPWWISLWGPMKQKDLQPWTTNTGAIIPFTYFSYFVGQNYIHWPDLRSLLFSWKLWAPAGTIVVLVWRSFLSEGTTFRRFIIFTLVASTMFFMALSFRFPRFGAGLPKYSFPFALLFNIILAMGIRRFSSRPIRWGVAFAYVIFQLFSYVHMTSEVFRYY